MKHRYIYIFALLTLFAMSACSDWLDISPRQEMREPDLFSNEEGFKDALTGAYIQLGEASLYGRNTTLYIPEFMAHNWDLTLNNPTSLSAGFENFDFTVSSVESMLNTVWRDYYNVIVQLNNLLNALETNEVNFNYDKDKLIKGEALGLRAFLHFELLRFFGPAPLDAVAGQNTIPYVTAMTKDVNLLVSLPWSQVLTLIEKDFNEAEALLATIDPILTEEDSDDDWVTMYRENRFNYYAVLAAKARFYQWIGNKESATTYARMVVDAKKKDDSQAFKLADDTEYGASDRIVSNLIMYSEMLFGIHNPKHQAVIQSLFKGEYASLKLSMEKVSDAYEAGMHPDDMRNKGRRYWEEISYSGGNKVNHFYKYTGNEEISTMNVIPVLRLSEMYFILIENEPLPEANDLFVEYRIARGMSNIVDHSLIDDQTVKERLEKEYRKEFFGEGQMFFFYKRFKYETYTWPSNFEVPENAYVLPLPKDQLAFE